MQNVMGIINLNAGQDLLKELTLGRPLAALPFGGRYRLIDFILSNMVNSGMQNVGILVQDKYRALMDHLRSGKEWDLARKRDGLFILPPSPNSCSSGGCRGNVENFYNNLDYIESSRQEYMLIAGSHIVCNLNYRKVFKFHQDMGADVTILYKEYEMEDELSQYTVLDCQPDGRIVDMGSKFNTTSSRKVSMEMYIIEKSLLVNLIKDCQARGGWDFVKDILIKNVGRLKLYGYLYKGYAARIDSIKNYYRHNMDLLRPEKWEELFFKSGLVYTKVKDEAPVKYKENARAFNTMVANGCIIEGRVENSILFRGVKVRKGAYVKDSIIMQKCEIAENAIIENVICDKNVCITQGKWLKGEKNYPLVVAKGTVV
jgi:glucose-1-phosphate adenylyltransferase